MSYSGRTWPKVAKKLFHLRPLAKQEVHLEDSVLGRMSTFPSKGLNASYQDLIQEAFEEEWWNSEVKFALDENGKPYVFDSELDQAKGPTDVFSLMEINFSLFWGLAIQMYESTLISDETPFDQFRSGVRVTVFNDRVLNGMNLFNGKAQCASCHRETLLAAATHENIDKLGVSISRFQADQKQAFLDTGFFNIGVRPTEENLGIGGLTPFNTPLSYSKVLHPEERLAINGAFKAPGLRNVALTAPYFHNGGKMTLEQVLDFYQIKGDYFAENSQDININLVNVDFDDEEQKDLEAFLTIGLTDPRVVAESAPFDHPYIFIPNGYKSDGSEVFSHIPAVGASGRHVEGFSPRVPFLQ
jgi:hypothetical protein